MSCGNFSHDNVAQANAESDTLRKRLESDMAAATANNIRESIRQSCMDLGTFFFDRSDFPAASKMFMRTRDLCSNNNQMLDFCIAVIRTYVMTQNWPMVSTFVGKAETMLNDPQTDRMKQIRAQMHAVAGLADLCMNRHKQSATNFSKVGAELGSSFDDIIASIDVARYGTLAALATHDRTALRPLFLNSPSFAVHLESMLEVRRFLYVCSPPLCAMADFFTMLCYCFQHAMLSMLPYGSQDPDAYMLL